MANTLTNPRVIRAARAIVNVDVDGVTVSTSATLASLFSVIQYTAKNIVITPPKGEVDQIDLLGETASTLGNTLTFQNYLLEEKAFQPAKMTATILFDVIEDRFDTMAGGVGVQVNSGNYSEYQYGASDSGSVRTQGAVLVLFKHGSAIREILLNNAFIVLGDIKATGADGHIERDVELVCAGENFHDRILD